MVADLQPQPGPRHDPWRDPSHAMIALEVALHTAWRRQSQVPQTERRWQFPTTATAPAPTAKNRQITTPTIDMVVI